MASASTLTSSERPTDGSSNRPKKRRKKREVREPAPVATGAWVTAFLMLGAAVFIAFVPLTRGTREDYSTDTTNWQTGKKSRVKLSLVSVDSERLYCASETEFGKLHCTYRNTKERYPNDVTVGLQDDNKRNLIQPYRTWPDNKLILVSGLWADPATATRVHREPYMGVAVEKLARFVVDCEVKFVGELKNFSTKWGPGQSWVDEKSAMVADVQSCTLVKPDN
jgi:hypothetical protein